MARTKKPGQPLPKPKPPRKKPTATRLPHKPGEFSDVDGPVKAQQDSKFMSIPPELRNRIYNLAFKDQVIRMPKHFKGSNEGRPEAPAILMACKQTHFEAVKIYYAATIFEFTNVEKFSSSRMSTWCRKIGKARRDLINNIYLRVEYVFSGPGGYGQCYYEAGGVQSILDYARTTVSLRPEVLKTYWNYEMVTNPLEVYEAGLAAERAKKLLEQQ